MKHLKTFYELKLLKEKGSKRLTYDNTFLHRFVEDHKITLIGTYDKVTLNSKITALCTQCDSEYTKKFQTIIRSNTCCLVCADKIGRIKLEITNIEKYGCKSSLGNKDVRKKYEETMKERYGYDNPSKVPECRENYKETMNERYGYDNPSKVPELIIKRDQTNLERYGFINPMSNEEIKKKCDDSLVKNLGVSNPMFDLETRQKQVATTMKNLGVSYPSQNEEVKQKAKETNLKRYGVDNPAKVEEFKEKAKQTNLERYGYEYATQNPEISNKASKTCLKFKDYIFPSGKIEKIQGYENFALDLLLEIYNEDNIVVGKGKVPFLKYKDSEGKLRTHTPDIFIPSENAIVEIKSEWTLKKKKDFVFLKQQAGIKAGYDYYIWVFDSKGNPGKVY